MFLCPISDANIRLMGKLKFYLSMPPILSHSLLSIPLSSQEVISIVSISNCLRVLRESIFTWNKEL